MSVPSKIIELARDLELSGFCVSDINIVVSERLFFELPNMHIFRVNSHREQGKPDEAKLAGIKIIKGNPNGK